MSAGKSATVTITGVIGPAQAITAQVISGVTEFAFDVVNNLFLYSIGTTRNQIAIDAATTVTVTLSAAGGNYTVSIS